MNKDEATKQWIAEYRTRMTRAMSDEEMAREMYEAGQRAERERIYRLALNVHKARSYEELEEKFGIFTDELRADPAESGE